MPVADISRDYFADCDDRDTFIEGYKTDIPYANGELTEGECDRAGLPRDPRLNYDWAWNVMLSDQIKEIVASRELIDVETEQNESVRKEQASSDAANSSMKYRNGSQNLKGPSSSPPQKFIQCSARAS